MKQLNEEKVNPDQGYTSNEWDSEIVQEQEEEREQYREKQVSCPFASLLIYPVEFDLMLTLVYRKMIDDLQAQLHLSNLGTRQL